MRFADSMAGRIFAILLVGIVLSALLALTLADGRRRAEVDRIRLEQVADRTSRCSTSWDGRTGRNGSGSRAMAVQECTSRETRPQALWTRR